MNLVFEQGGLAGQVYPLERTMIYIGRTGENDLVLPEQAVSRRHASIQQVSQGWLLTDLGSTNGSYVDGQRIQEPHLLRPGERVAMGDSIFLIQQSGVTGAHRAEQEGRKGAPRSLPRPVLILGAVCLVVLLVGLVLLLVTIFQPEEAPPVATPEGQMDGLLTALPVPTQMQDMMTSIVPMFSTVLPGFPLGPTATLEPGSSISGPEIAAASADGPAALSGSREVDP